MSFFSHAKKESEAVVLVEIGAGSVAGAYCLLREGEAPAILYTERIPITFNADIPHERSLLNSLNVLGDKLLHDGAPTLARATGSGSAHTILVSIEAPWQETSVRTEHIERDAPFIFTKGLVDQQLKRTRLKSSEKILADESIVGTVLNGYNTHDPYEKKAQRALVVVLTSIIDRHISEHLTNFFKKLFHTRQIVSISGNSLRYQAMRVAFPHDSDAIIIDATGSLTSISLVRQNLLVATVETAENGAQSSSWATEIKNIFVEIAKLYPLPRTVFLLGNDSDMPLLQEKLTAANLNDLWLSLNPPQIVPVLGKHIVGLVQQATTQSPDLNLLLMALYYQQRVAQEEDSV